MTEPGFRQKLRAELETPLEHRPFGSGWLSCMLAFLLAVGCLVLSLCRAFPGVFIMPQGLPGPASV